MKSAVGRIVVTVAAAAALVAATLVVMHYVRSPEFPPPTAPPPGEAKAGEGAAVAGQPKGPALAPPPPGPGEAEADDGLALAASGRLAQAQVRLSQSLRAGVDGPKGKAVRDAVMSLADRVQFGGEKAPDDPYAKSYNVVKGDAIITIGRRFLIPGELVMRLNRLGSPSIQAGQSLKVIQGPIHVEIYKARHELQAWCGDVCIRVYPVGIGKVGSTPEGTFTVKSKLRNPPYQPMHKPRTEFRDPGAADNPLGTRWIDIGNHYGIHGTIDPASVGRDVSEGCIRLHGKDVEELFDLVVEGASKVTIRP